MSPAPSFQSLRGSWTIGSKVRAYRWEKSTDGSGAREIEVEGSVAAIQRGGDEGWRVVVVNRHSGHALAFNPSQVVLDLDACEGCG